MFDKNITIYCKMEDNLKVQKVVEGYTNDVMMVEAKDDIVRLTITCSIFKVNRLRQDIKILNNVGIKTEMKEA